MKTKTIVFYIVIGFHSTLLFLLFVDALPIKIDSFAITFLFGFIGISLLPFADKLKLGSIIEFERLKETIEEVKQLTVWKRPK